MESVNIKELNDRIQQESSFVDLLSLEMFDPSNHSIELLSSGDPASLYRIFSII